MLAPTHILMSFDIETKELEIVLLVIKVLGRIRGKVLGEVRRLAVVRLCSFLFSFVSFFLQARSRWGCLSD